MNFLSLLHLRSDLYPALGVVVVLSRSKGLVVRFLLHVGILFLVIFL